MKKGRHRVTVKVLHKNTFIKHINHYISYRVWVDFRPYINLIDEQFFRDKYSMRPMIVAAYDKDTIVKLFKAKVGDYITIDGMILPSFSYENDLMFDLL